MLKNSRTNAEGLDSFTEIMGGGVAQPTSRLEDRLKSVLAESASRPLRFDIDVEAIEDIIRPLRDRFIERAARLGRDLSSHLNVIDTDSNAGIPGLTKIAHDLAGNAATFGFPLLGQVAFTLSEAVRGHEPDFQADIGKVRELGQRLLSVLNEIAFTHGE